MSTYEPAVLLADAPGPDAARVAATAAAFFAQAVDDPVLGARLRRADTTVHLRIGAADGVTLRLERLPIEVERGIVGDAEVEIRTPPETLLRCARGERHAVMLLIEGEAAWSGPVRKFLSVVPILRTFDTSVWSRRRLGG